VRVIHKVRVIDGKIRYYQPTFVQTLSLFVYLSQYVSYNLSWKVSFIYTSQMVEINRVAIKFNFKPGLSATETLVLVQKSYGNEALN
jgi:hypothetical protein